MTAVVVTQPVTGAILRTVPAAPGDTVYDALTRAGVPLATSCRGSTICGRCHVRVCAGGEGLPPPLPDEARLLEAHAPPGARLACRLRLLDGMRLVLTTADWARLAAPLGPRPPT